MGVYKRKLAKGIRYFYSGQYKGKKYFSKAMYTSRGERLRAERVNLEELERDLTKPQHVMTLLDIMNKRLDEMKANQSEHYYIEIHRYFRMLLEHVGDVPVNTITKAQINSLLLDFSKQLKKSGHSNHSANAMLRSLKALFNYAIRIFDIDMRNPCVGIKFLPVEIKLKYIPSDKEIAVIRDLLDDEERLLFDFVEETGCRINEAISLQYDDIQDSLVTLKTHKSKNSNLTPRRIPVPSCLSGINRKAKGRIFSRWNNKPRFLEEHIKKIGQKRWNWHNLRHRRASIWAGEGRTLLEIMQLLGHTNLSTTQKYLQILGHIRL